MHVTEYIADAADAVNGKESSHARSTRVMHSANEESTCENIGIELEGTHDEYDVEDDDEDAELSNEMGACAMHLKFIKEKTQR